MQDSLASGSWVAGYNAYPITGMNLLQPHPFLMLPLSESEPQKGKSECQVQAPVHHLAKEAHGPVSDSPSEIACSDKGVLRLRCCYRRGWMGRDKLGVGDIYVIYMYTYVIYVYVKWNTSRCDVSQTLLTVY